MSPGREEREARNGDARKDLQGRGAARSRAPGKGRGTQGRGWDAATAKGVHGAAGDGGAAEEGGLAGADSHGTGMEDEDGEERQGGVPVRGVCAHEASGRVEAPTGTARVREGETDGDDGRGERRSFLPEEKQDARAVTWPRFDRGRKPTTVARQCLFARGTEILHGGTYGNGGDVTARERGEHHREEVYSWGERAARRTERRCVHVVARTQVVEFGPGSHGALGARFRHASRMGVSFERASWRTGEYKRRM